MFCGILTVFIWMAQSAMADQQTIYDQYSLQASAEGDVENDLMRVRMAVQHEDRDAAALADKVNTDMQWALEHLGRFESIRYKTENYSTHPEIRAAARGWLEVIPDGCARQQ